MRQAALKKLAIALLLLLTPVWLGIGGESGTPVERGLNYAGRNYLFSLARWEAEALTERAGRILAPSVSPGRDSEADRALVERYAELTALIQSRGTEYERRLLVDDEKADGSDEARASLPSLLSEVASLRAERDGLAPPVETVLGWQIESVLRDEGLRDRTVSLQTRSQPPFFTLAIAPGVAFRLGETPLLLIASRRDRIELVGSVLLDPSLSYSQINNVEFEADRARVSSLVTEIGGLAAYPSMVPASGSLQQMVETVSHEWVHHYLIFRPLGQEYFSGYEMRTLNETTADIIGREVGDRTLERYYAFVFYEPEDLPEGQPREPEESTFGRLMRETRQNVEAYLARGAVAEAEEYMVRRRLELAREGYNIRRLNTAYLSFFGAYSGSANPYEKKLRELRARSGSLRQFVSLVEEIKNPAELDRLLE